MELGPGPVADVRVRYKDLVRLDNAVARARLALPATATRGALSALESALPPEVIVNRVAGDGVVDWRVTEGGADGPDGPTPAAGGA